MVIPEDKIIEVALEIFGGEEIKKLDSGKITISEMRKELKCKESDQKKN